MSLPVVLRDAAVAELEEAFDFYERRRQGLGIQFATHIRSLLTHVAANPHSAPVVLADIRRLVVNKYPFCIFYRITVDRIDVLAVFHTSRNPAIWKSRI